MQSETIPKKYEFGEIRIGDIARKHLKDVCDTNWVSEGPKVKQFEKEWGSLFGYQTNVATSSGTDACINACLSLYDLVTTDAKIGDEIIVPALGFIATSNAVRVAGFKPVFVDVKKETLNIDETKIEAAITLKTKAIFVVHTMGRPCEMDVITEIATRYNLVVIEDSCEGHGAVYQGKRIGLWGDMACFSFYIAHLVCSGEGGMVSSKHPWVEKTLRSTKSHGRSGIYFDHPRFGINSKMNDLEASVGLEGIAYFQQTFDKRHDNVQKIRIALIGYEDVAWFSEEDEGNINCPHAFSITMKSTGNRDILTNYLESKSIHWKRNFGSIPTQQGAFSYLGHKLGDFPNAEHIGDNGIHIGVHQFLSDEDIQFICQSLQEGLTLMRSQA